MSVRVVTGLLCDEPSGSWVSYEDYQHLMQRYDEIDSEWHERFREQANQWHERTAMLRRQNDKLLEMLATQSALVPRTYIINKDSIQLRMIDSKEQES